MRAPLVAAVSLMVAFLLIEPTVEGTQREFKNYNLGWKFPWDPFTWNLHPPLPPPAIPANGIPPACGKEDRATVTIVTKFPTLAEKGEKFEAQGYVHRAKDQPGAGNGVGGIPVDVFLNKTKKANGTLIGRVTTDATGAWNLSADLPPNILGARYQLVDHALPYDDGCEHFLSSWSDPAVRIHSRTTLDLACPTRTLVGDPLLCKVELWDVSHGAVPDHNITVTVDGRALPRVTTDASGAAYANLTGVATGNHTLKATFASDLYYGASSNSTSVHVAQAFLDLTPTDVRLSRGVPGSLQAHLRVGPGADPSLILLRATVAGFELQDPPCTSASCPLVGAFTFHVAPNGTLALPLRTLRSEMPADGKLTVVAPELDEPSLVTLHLLRATNFTLLAPGEPRAWSASGASAKLVDESGAPLPGRNVTLTSTQDGAVHAFTARTGVDGVAHFDVAGLPHGDATFAFAYLGTQQEGPSTPPGVHVPVPYPWWFWGALVASAVVVAAVAYGLWRWRQAYLASLPPPPVILPSLGVRIVENTDEAPALVAPGECVIIEVDAWPGAAALLLAGAPHLERPARIALTGAGPQRIALEATSKGDGRLQVVAVDANGTALAEGSVDIRVVEYAEEVERAYRELLRARVGEERAASRITPREFEAFLRESHRHIPHATLSRLVSMFEVADYSTRHIDRQAYLAYLAAERGVQQSAIEVIPLAN